MIHLAPKLYLFFRWPLLRTLKITETKDGKTFTHVFFKRAILRLHIEKNEESGAIITVYLINGTDVEVTYVPNRRRSVIAAVGAASFACMLLMAGLLYQTSTIDAVNPIAAPSDNDPLIAQPQLSTEGSHIITLDSAPLTDAPAAPVMLGLPDTVSPPVTDEGVQ